MIPRHLPPAILRSAAAAILLAANALAAPELSSHRPLGKAVAVPSPEAGRSLGALRFEQVDAGGAARFSARAGAGRVTLDARGIALSDGDATNNIRIDFAGSRPATRLVGEQRLRSTASYFVGNDPRRWRHDVAEYSRVRYEDVYPAVDAVVYDAGRGLEYDFVVAPGGNPAAIRLAFDGASSVRIDLSGGLLVEVSRGKVVRHAPPIAFQVVGGVLRAVAARFVAREGGFGFETSAYDCGAALVIDPTIDFSTLYGAGQDFATDVAVDAAGNAYVVGSSLQDNFPVTRDPGQVTTPIPGFLYKVSPSGELLFSIVFGGNGSDDPRAVVIDPDGNPVVVGGTSSFNYPLVDAFQTTANSYSSAFVTKFSSDGSRILFSTLFGGTGLSGALGVACRPGGRIYVSGAANEGLQLVNAADSTQVEQELFVALLDTSAHRVVFSTYLGGSEDEHWATVAVDPSGAAYVLGSTRSPDFPTANAYQPGLRGCCDHVVTKLSPGGEIVYSTYLGGDGGEEYYGNIAVRPDGSAVVFGNSFSSNFPTVNALFGPSPEPFDVDAVIAELTPAGDGLVFSTYLGGDGIEEAYGLDVDAAGTIWVAGRTQSSDFPLVHELQSQPDPSGPLNGFLSRISADGRELLFSTYLGGASGDTAYGVAAFGAGRVWVTGITGGEGFPLVNPIQSTIPIAGVGTTFLTLVDASDGEVTPPVIASIAAVQSPGQPLRLRITGENFQPSARVFIGDDATPWPQVKAKGTTSLKLKGALQPRFPRGVAVTVRVENPDGGSATGSYTRGRP